MVIARPAQPKIKNGTYVFIEKAKKFIHQLKQEMFRLQNHPRNMNMIKFRVSYQEKGLVWTLDHLMILMYRFVRKTGNYLQKQQMVLVVSSNLFQALFKYFFHNTHNFLSSYCLGYESILFHINSQCQVSRLFIS